MERQTRKREEGKYNGRKEHVMHVRNKFIFLTIGEREKTLKFEFQETGHVVSSQEQVGQPPIEKVFVSYKVLMI